MTVNEEPWVAGFYEALLRFVQQFKPEATKVTGWDDSASDPGGCPTCHSGLEYEVDIYYRTDDKRLKYDLTYTYQGKFTDLLNHLTKD